MSPNIRVVIILVGLILLALLGVLVTKKYERNPDEAEVLSSYVAIPIILTIYYIYIANFSFITYILSIGAIVLLFT